MNPVFLAFFFAAAAIPHAGAAPAKTPVRADLPGYTGFDDCRIAPLEPAPRKDIVEWNGACESGFATGKGELDWKDEQGKRYRLKATLVCGEVQGEGELKTESHTYTGTLLRGRPHGAGYILYKGGNQFEGHFVNGRQEGKGTFVWTDGSEYNGEWKNGLRHGQGEITYPEGGSYSGEWQAGKRHGRGRLVYTGSGRQFEGQFDNDLVAGTVPLVEEHTPESLLRRDRSPYITGYLPLDLSWEELSEPQKNVVRNMYRALRPGDEPPYPAGGMRDLFEAVSKANGSVGATGNLLIDVVVGADGKGKKIRIYEKPQADDKQHADWLMQQVADAMLLKTYKPAICDGQPCEMRYVFFFSFDTRLTREVPAMFR